MRSHEEKTARCHDYLTPQVNATHRKQMVEWYVDFADAFALSKETLGVAVSILDRYLSSGNENSHEALKSLQAFQRAAVTPFFNSLCAILRFFRWSRVRLFSNFPIQPLTAAFTMGRRAMFARPPPPLTRLRGAFVDSIS
jgi:hypothetical protein